MGRQYFTSLKNICIFPLSSVTYYLEGYFDSLFLGGVCVCVCVCLCVCFFERILGEGLRM